MTEQSEGSGEIYHEKQRLQLCAVHALNNLFQTSDACSKHKLDQLCLQLDPARWNNAHRSILGTGNYDINVIMAFLQSLDLDVLWFDKRKSISTIEMDLVFGFLINIPSPLKLFGFNIGTELLNSKHWYAIRKLKNEEYYNLDSKLPQPVKLGGEEELVGHLRRRLEDGRSELLLVVETGVTQEQVIKES